MILFAIQQSITIHLSPRFLNAEVVWEFNQLFLSSKMTNKIAWRASPGSRRQGYRSLKTSNHPHCSVRRLQRRAVALLRDWRCSPGYNVGRRWRRSLRFQPASQKSKLLVLGWRKPARFAIIIVHFANIIFRTAVMNRGCTTTNEKVAQVANNAASLSADFRSHSF